MLRVRATAPSLAVLLRDDRVGARGRDGAARARSLRGTLEGRAYRVWVPTRPAPERPLVVALHGCWQTPEDFALGTRLNDAAERRGLVVVYPAQDALGEPVSLLELVRPDRSRRPPARDGADPRHRAPRAGRARAARSRRVVLGFSAGGVDGREPHLRRARRGGSASARWPAAPIAAPAAPEAAIQCMRGTVRDGAAAAAACAGGGRQAPRLRVSLWHGAARHRRQPGESHRAGGDVRACARRQRRRLTSTERGRRALASTVISARRAGARDVAGAGIGHAWSGGDPRGTHTWPPGPPTTDRMLDFLLSGRAEPCRASAAWRSGCCWAPACWPSPPFRLRATWWGGWILAVAEAGIVGGLADWFAVTAIFRRPLGLPIPHTALIPHNWERMAARVGVMVGGRVLTKEYVREEIARIDLADLLARGAERISRADLETRHPHRRRAGPPSS